MHVLISLLKLFCTPDTDSTGFQKENLKVQLDNYTNLRTGGQRPLTGNRWLRFRKEFQIPNKYNTGKARAKFENGLLTVNLP